MPEPGHRLWAVLDGFAKFLRDKELALPKHRPFLVRWVREFLAFATDHAGYTFEQALDLLLAEVGRRAGIEPWQLQQASDAIRVYRYQYRRADAPEHSDGRRGGAPMDDGALLARLREVIRLRHYAQSTEKSYVHSPPTSCSMGRTSARSRNCLGTRAWRRR